MKITYVGVVAVLLFGMGFVFPCDTRADVLTWTGEDSSDWNSTAENFIGPSGKSAFVGGSDVLIDDTAGNRTATMTESSTIGSLTFSIDNDFTMTSASTATMTPSSFVKEGTGTLWWSPVWRFFNQYSGLIDIRGGKIAISSTQQYPTLGLAEPAATYEIHDGATLEVRMRNSISGDVSAGQNGVNVIVHTNGTFALQKTNSDSLQNFVRTLTLDGGSLSFSASGHANYGLLGITEKLSCLGPAPYVFLSSPSYSNQHMFFGNKTKTVEIAVSDITGIAAGAAQSDNLPDVTFAAGYPMVRPLGWTTALRKTGEGTLVWAATVPSEGKAINGDIAVEDGALVLTNICSVWGGFDRKISVSEKAKLVINHFNPFYPDTSATAYTVDPVKITTGVEIDGGTLVLERGLAGGRTGQVQFGPLTLNNAKFDYSGWDYGDAGKGAIAFTGKVTFRGTNAYSLVQSSSKSSRKDRQKICLWDEPLTEFCVDEITDGKSDVVLAHDLINRPNGKSGFIKSGTGTLQLGVAGNYCGNGSDYSGDIVVREGVLQVGPDSQTEFTGSYLGRWNTTMAERTLTIEENGTLYIPNRALFAFTTTNAQQNAKAVVRGKFKVGDGQFVIWPKLEMDGGTLDFGAGGKAGYGSLVIGALSFVGNKAQTIVLPAGQSADYSTMISVNTYPSTVIDVADSTADSAVDATIERPLGICEVHRNNNLKGGFVKKGLGTLRLTSAAVYNNQYRLNGGVDVVGGALLVDGRVLEIATNVLVGAGAYLGGTGVVSRVTIAAGGGLCARAMVSAPLNVTGKLTIEGVGSIRIDGLGSGDLENVNLQVVTASGGVEGAENLNSWKVYAGGVDVSERIRLRLNAAGTSIGCKSIKGLLMLIR